MTQNIRIKIVFWVLFIGITFFNPVLSQNKIVSYKPEIKSYIDYIKTQTESPFSYILEKFKSFDILVFAERDHRDITQYYFIEQLINIPEFYQQVGAIYTEVGSSNFNDTLNKVLHNYSISEEAINKKLIEIYREISYQAFWDKYNFFYLWKVVYKFNKAHPDYSISIQMTSHPFDWQEIKDTTSCRIHTNEVEKNYDKKMAEFFIKSYAEFNNSKRSKAFVIMNYPHSLKKWTSSNNTTYERMFSSFINQVYSDKVCYIMANTYNLNNFMPVSNGKWDAAFKFCNFPSIGFDFKNTPFGVDTFDVWPSKKGILTYENILTGIVFINPTNECKNIIGIPEFLDKQFAEEYIRRLKLRMYYFKGKEYKTKLKWEKKYCNKQRTFTVYDENNKFDKTINQWLLMD